MVSAVVSPRMLCWHHGAVAIAVAFLALVDSSADPSAVRLSGSDLAGGSEALLQVEGQKNPDPNQAPRLISVALKRLVSGLHHLLGKGAVHGNATQTQLFRYVALPAEDASTAASKKLEEIEHGINKTAMSLETWVAQASTKNDATTAANEHAWEVNANETARLVRAASRVKDATKQRSAAKAKELAALQRQKELMVTELRRRMGNPDGPQRIVVAPHKSAARRELPSGNLHALQDYLTAPKFTPVTDAPATVTAVTPAPVEEPASGGGVAKRLNASRATMREMAAEAAVAAMAPLHPKKGTSVKKAEKTSPIEHLRRKKVSMSRNLRHYLHLPTQPPPPSQAKDPETHEPVSPARQHLLIAEDLIKKMYAP